MLPGGTSVCSMCDIVAVVSIAGVVDCVDKENLGKKDSCRTVSNSKTADIDNHGNTACNYYFVGSSNIPVSRIVSIPSRPLLPNWTPVEVTIRRNIANKVYGIRAEVR